MQVKHPQVLITGLYIYPGQIGGTEQYLYNLLRGFAENGYAPQVEIWLNQAYKASFPPIVYQFERRYFQLNVSRTWYDLVLPTLDKAHFKHKDVLFCPNYLTPLYPTGSQIGIATTIHDLQFRHYPEFFHRRWRAWQTFAHGHALRRSQAIVCISDFVRNDFLRVYGDKYAHKLHVIPNPIDWLSRFQIVEEQGSAKPFPFPYILSVAAMYPHKNTLTLVKAFEQIQAKYPELRLVLAGQLTDSLKGGKYAQYSTQLQELISGNPAIIQTGFIDDVNLGNLYANCAFFVFPSLFEGFGMPAVEAMSFGKPVLTSRRTSLPEVTLYKAQYIEDPLNINEVATRMAFIYDKLDHFTAEAQQLAPIIRQQYAPGVVAQQYQALFEKIAGGGK